MTRRPILVVAVLTVALSAFAQPDLKSRVEAATGAEKAKLAVEFTEQATKAADRAFKDDKDDEGSADLKAITEYARIAFDASVQARKREKETEIGLRKVLKHLVDIKNARPVDQQDEVQKTINAVLVVHDKLLDSMFQKNRK
jgi:hypothetical protein